MEGNEERAPYWRRHVEAFEASGQTRREYSEQHGIKVKQLDYWRGIARQGKSSRPIIQGKSSSSFGQWIPVQVSEAPNVEESQINIWVGTARIEVRHGFDRELLLQVLRALEGIAC